MQYDVYHDTSVRCSWDKAVAGDKISITSTWCSLLYNLHVYLVNYIVKKETCQLFQEKVTFKLKIVKND